MNTQAPLQAGKREWVGLAVIALPCLLYSMDLTVLHLAVPRLSIDLEPSSAQLLWIIDIYGFLVAGSLVTAGTLGDRIGRRRILLIGASFFGCASLLAAFSRTAAMLIASRALLGVAGATVAPSTLSLIRNMFLDARQRTTAISIWIMTFSLRGGLWTLPWSIGFILGSLATPALARRVPPGPLISWGLALSALGYFLLAGTGGGGGHFAGFAVATFILTLRASPVYTVTNDIIIGSAPPERAGAASGISETCAEFGGALGIAIFGSIGVAIYRAMLADTLPAGIPHEAGNAALATLGGAVVVARDLPVRTGGALVDAARDAFMRGLVVCQVIGGAGALALAVLASTAFRPSPAPPSPTGSASSASA